MSGLKKPGPPPLVLPQEFIDVLEETYEEGLPNSIPIENSDEGHEWIKAGKLYASRVGKSFRSDWSTDGKTLSYQLTNKRTYRKSTLPREK